jgi:hypothetical protein
LTTQVVVLYDEVTMFRALRRNGLLVPSIAALAAFAFLLAINYCVCEAFSADHAHNEPAQQHSPAGHHDDHIPTSEDQANPCCATLQAVIFSRGILQVASSTPTLLPSIASLGVEITLRTQLATVPSGLSPPAQALPPRLPFYRTTYANHAPPVLA